MGNVGAAGVKYYALLARLCGHCQSDPTTSWDLERTIFAGVPESCCGVWTYSNSIVLFTQCRSIDIAYHPPSWMASWGAPTCKPSKLWGTPLQPQQMTRAIVGAGISSDLWILVITRWIRYLWNTDHSNILHLIAFDISGFGCPNCSGLSVKPSVPNLQKLVSGWKSPPKRRNQMDQCQCPSLSKSSNGIQFKVASFLVVLIVVVN